MEPEVTFALIGELFDAAAEALILVDLEDAGSTDELVARLEAIAGTFACDDEAHPAWDAVAAAQTLPAGGTAALDNIERAYMAARTQVERAVRASSPSPSDSAGEGKATANTARENVGDAMPLAGDDELLRDFGVRAVEHLDDADEQLVALENDTLDASAVDAVFRAFHTIKGMAGFLALDAISELAHETETQLSDARANKTAVAEVTVQRLFSAVDRMRHLVFDATGIGDMTAAHQSRSAEQLEPLEVSVLEAAKAAEQQETAPAAGAADARTAASDARKAAGSSREGTVRVEEARLDALLDTIGEMVIAESMVSAGWHTGMDEMAVATQIDRLDKISRELQQMATSLRMVPLRATFRRMGRLVRDLAHKANKQVDFVITGEDTELDKVVVDRIADPLIHMLRNAVDHGIESADERAAAGKPATARVELRAFHAGGAIHIEVTDDGRGFDRERILARAIERGLVSADDSLSEAEIFNLTLQPGFSTAETVTDISGRGVGMDVVKRTVEELRGRIDVRSESGRGTTVSVRLPITLAIIDGMVARVGAERYIVPMVSIERSVRCESERISTIGGKAEMLEMSDGMLPILRLHRLFDSTDAETDLTQGVLIIISDNGVRAGLFACELLGQQQTVIKPLGEGLPEQQGITGGAIMPDGRVGLILDAPGLVRLSHTSGTGRAQ